MNEKNLNTNTEKESANTEGEAVNTENESVNTENGNGNAKSEITKKNKKADFGLWGLLITPFILLCIGIGFLSVFFFKEYVESSNVWRFFVNTGAVTTPSDTDSDTDDGEDDGSLGDLSIEAVSKPDTSDDTSVEVDENQIYYNKKDFPGYKWGVVWGKLSIPAIGLENKKIYVGESNEIYKKGIGKRFGTRFPGQGGNIVLGAHVTREFYDLQELVIGDKVYIHTEYGEYVYEVYETLIFSIDDTHYVMNYDEGEKLTLYTCHPRGTAYRTERYAVLCKKISGPEWIAVD